MKNYFATLIYLLFMVQISLTWRFHYALLYHLSFGVLVVIGLWIALTFVVGFYLKDRSNPVLQAIGTVYEQVFMYTAPMQGVLYTTLVFFVVGGAINAELPLPAFERAFMFDWLYGTYYATWLVYGLGFTCMLLFFQSNTALTLVLSLLIGAISWGIGVFCFFFEPTLRAIYEANMSVVMYLHIAIQIFLSTASMYAALHSATILQRKAKPRKKSS